MVQVKPTLLPKTQLLIVGLFIVSSCVSGGSYRPLFYGEREKVEIATSAADRCGVNDVRQGDYDGQTALFVASKTNPNSAMDCLYRWWREERPAGLGMIVVTR